MKKCNQFLCYLLLSVSMAALVACHSLSKPEQGTPAINDIQKTLMHGVVTNQRIAAGEDVDGVPVDIDQALLPALSVEKADQAQERRFNISVKGVPVNTFFMSLVKDTDYNMIVSPRVSGSISLDLKRVTLEQILKAVHDTYGYRYRRTSYGYEIYPAGLETRIFTVDYLNVSRSGQSNTSISSGQITQKITGGGDMSSGASLGVASSNVRESAPTSNVVTKSTSDFWGTLGKTLTAIVGSKGGRQVIVDSQTNTVIIKAMPDELKRVAEYLDALKEKMTRQVILEAKILEVKLNHDYQAGVNWKLLGLSQGDVFNPSDFSSPAVTPTDVLSDITKNIFTLHASKGGVFSAIIQLLSTQGNVQVLSSPRISTLNNQKAVIKVGTDEFFITNVSDTSTGTGDGTTTSQDIDLTPFFSGIALDVTPEIDDQGDVILHIHPIVSKVVDQTKSFTVFGRDQELPMALSDIRESDSIVHAKNGQVVVIGGLIETKTEEDVGATPGASKVPVLGHLFRRNKQVSQKSELVILLRPVVVCRNNQTWTRDLNQTAHRFQKMNQGYHMGAHHKVFGNLGEKHDHRKVN